MARTCHVRQPDSPVELEWKRAAAPLSSGGGVLRGNVDAFERCRYRRGQAFVIDNTAVSHPHRADTTQVKVLAAISFSHFLNDTVQSLVPAIYPILKSSFHLTFAQIGLITFSLQLTASLLQPLVGWYT